MYGLCLFELHKFRIFNAYTHISDTQCLCNVFMQRFFNQKYFVKVFKNFLVRYLHLKIFINQKLATKNGLDNMLLKYK